MAVDRGGLQYTVDVLYNGDAAVNAFLSNVERMNKVWDDLREKFRKPIAASIKVEFDTAGLKKAQESLTKTLTPQSASIPLGLDQESIDAVRALDKAEEELSKNRVRRQGEHKRGGPKEAGDVLLAHDQGNTEAIARQRQYHLDELAAYEEEARRQKQLHLDHAAALGEEESRQKRIHLDQAAAYAEQEKQERAKGLLVAAAYAEQEKRERAKGLLVADAYKLDEERSRKIAALAQKQSDDEIKANLKSYNDRVAYAQKLKAAQQKELQAAHAEALRMDKARDAALASQQANAPKGSFSRFISIFKRDANEGEAAAGKFAASLERIFTRVVFIAALHKALSLVKLFVNTLLGFNSRLESARTGLASLFLAVGDLRDGVGDVVTPTRGFAIAQEEATRQTEKLRLEALKTTATFEELVVAYKSAVAPGLQAGLNLDQIRQFSIQISQAATALGVSQDQLSEEIRSILSGTINVRNTRIAAALGIENSDIKQAKEAGQLFDFLQSKFSAFTVASSVAANNFEVILQKVKGSLEQVISAGGQNFFLALKQGLKDVQDSLIQINRKGLIEPNPKAVAVIKEIAKGFEQAVVEARSLAKEFGFEGLLSVGTALGAIIKGLVVIGSGVIKGIVQSVNDIVYAFKQVYSYIVQISGKDPFKGLNLRDTVATITRLAVGFAAIKLVLAALPIPISTAVAGIQTIIQASTALVGIIATIGIFPTLVAAAFALSFELARQLLSYLEGVDIKYVTLFEFFKVGIPALISTIADAIKALGLSIISLGYSVFKRVAGLASEALSLVLAFANNIVLVVLGVGDKLGIPDKTLQSLEDFASKLAKLRRETEAYAKGSVSDVVTAWKRVGAAFNQVADNRLLASDNIRKVLDANATNPTMFEFMKQSAAKAAGEIGSLLSSVIGGIKLPETQFSEFASSTDSATDSVIRFSDAFKEIPAVSNPALESLKALSGTLEKLKEDEKKLAQETQFGISALGVQGSVLSEQKAAFDGMLEVQKLTKQLSIDESNEASKVVGLRATQLRLQTEINALSSEDQTALKTLQTLYASQNESLKERDRLTTLLQVREQDLAKEKARGDTKNAGLTETIIGGYQVRIKALDGVIARTKDYADALSSDLPQDRAQKIYDLFKQTQEVTSQLPVALERQNILATEREGIEERINRQVSLRTQLLAEQSSKELEASNKLLAVELQNQKALKGSDLVPGFTLPEVKVSVTAANTLRSLAAQTEQTQKKRDLELQILNALIAQKQERAAQAVADFNANPQNEKEFLSSRLASQNELNALKAQEAKLAEQNALATEKETMALSAAADEAERAKMAIERPLQTGLLAGLTQTITDFGDVAKGVATVVQGTFQKMASTIGDAIVDAFDPNKKVNIKERLAQFLREIARMIIQTFIQIAIAKAIANALSSSFGGAGGGFGGFFTGGAGAGAGAVGRADGGLVPNAPSPMVPAGLPATDTVPIWATPNEFMIRAGSVMAYGADFFDALNRGFMNPQAVRAALGFSGSRGVSARPRLGYADGGLIGRGTSTSATPSASAPSGPVPAYVVANEQTLDKLLTGGKNSMHRWLNDNGYRRA